MQDELSQIEAAGLALDVGGREVHVGKTAQLQVGINLLRCLLQHATVLMLIAGL